MRREFLLTAMTLIVAVGVVSYFVPWMIWMYAVLSVPLTMGFYDYFQGSHTIRRNFPLLGRIRYWFEAIRPEINQYFVESNSEGVPFSREQRSLLGMSLVQLL